MAILADVVFPIYLLPERARTLPSGEIIVPVRNRNYLVYDKSTGGALASNRLKYSWAHTECALYTFRATLFFIQDLFIRKAKSRKFIDSNGVLFTYTPTIRATLSYYKIRRFRETASGYVVFLYGIPHRFLINRMPTLGEHYAGLLHIGKGTILYELCNTYKSKTWRLI